MSPFFSPSERANHLKSKIKKIVWSPWTEYWPDPILREKYISSVIRSSSTLFSFVWRNWSDSSTLLTEIEDALLFAIKGHATQSPRKTGEPYVIHPINVAISCAEHGLDKTGIISALLHDIIEDTDSTKKDIALRFGSDVAEIVDGLSKVKSKNKSMVDRDKVNTFVKIVAAEQSDNLLRTLLIKILDRRDNMKTVEVFREEKQKRYAQETIYIYSSLASILGLRLVANELIAKSLKPFFPHDFPKIDKKCELRQRVYIHESTPLQDAIRKIVKDRINIKFLHYYPSISDYLDSDTHELKLSAPPLKLRIRVPSLPDIYTVLGYIHSIGVGDSLPGIERNPDCEIKVISNNWKDYVVNPLSNGYAAIMTTVMFRDHSWILELVSQETEGIIDWGILSNFKSPELRNFYYTSINAFINNITNLNTMRYNDLQTLAASAVADIQVRLASGSFRRIPHGCTVIELAYLVDSDLGLYCDGAIVNGEKQSPLYKLKHGETVDITTQDIPVIKLAYFNALKSTTALENYRETIRNYFTQTAYERGKTICKQFIETYSINATDFIDKDGEFIKCTTDEIVDIGIGKATIASVLESHGAEVPYQGLFAKQLTVIPRIIYDFSDLMYFYPDCCNVVPSVDEDVVMQYIPKETNSEFPGLIHVHKKSCENLDLNRVCIPVEWEIDFPREIPLKFKVKDTIGLAGQITGIISKNQLNILYLNVSPHSDKTLHYIYITLELRQDTNKATDHKRFINCIKMLRKIKEVKRIEISRE